MTTARSHCACGRVWVLAYESQPEPEPAPRCAAIVNVWEGHHATVVQYEDPLLPHHPIHSGRFGTARLLW